MPPYGVCTPATYPPLGQILIASYLSTDNQVILIDGLAHPNDCTEKHLMEILHTFNPDIVGIRIMFINYFHALKIARIIKTFRDNVVVVTGGPHSSLLKKEILVDNSDVDIVMVGEGELNFQELVFEISKIPPDYSRVHGIIFRDSKQNNLLVETPNNRYVNLGETLPRYDLLDMDFYMKINLMTIEGRRGCANSCIFCGLPLIQGNQVREKPIDKVIEEIKYIYTKYKITRIEFVEPNFTINKLWVKDLCNRLIIEKLNIEFVCRTYVELVNPEVLFLMKQAGFVQIFYGIESGSQKILDEYKRPARVDDSINAIRWTKEAGIKTSVNFVIGAPSETEETIDETIKLAKLINVDDVDISILAPFPNTNFYNDKKIKMLDKKWYKKLEYTSRFPWFVAYETENFNTKELQDIWLYTLLQVKGIKK